MNKNLEECIVSYRGPRKRGTLHRSLNQNLFFFFFFFDFRVCKKQNFFANYYQLCKKYNSSRGLEFKISLFSSDSDGKCSLFYSERRTYNFLCERGSIS